MSRLVSVKVNYPPGLEAMVHSFKLCATARLFLQDLIPHVEAGIFLDNDIVVMDDLSLLWDRFHLFSSETAMAMAPVEPHYGAMVMVRHLAIFDLICITSRGILDIFNVFLCGNNLHWTPTYLIATSDLILWSSWSWPQCWCGSSQLDQVKTKNSNHTGIPCLQF